VIERRLTSDHEAHEHCGCCGRCFTWLATSFCSPCRSRAGHLGTPDLFPWDRTYAAIHGEPCPFTEAVAA